ncbi:MAG: hypothetical protein OXU20_24525 [Myxococcales bacterium]|nr:hypothetical protein [Myxococcales bacterium]
MSFSCDLERNVWNDLEGRPKVDGRPVPGNVVGLVMALDRVGFRDALLHLQREYVETGEQVRDSVGDVVDRTPDAPPTRNEVFGKELRGLRHDVPLLKECGIEPERARYYGIGYCSRGLMKGRVVFPIRNIDGEIVAYMGRSLRDDDPDGIWRSPNGFHRSLELDGIDRVAHDEETKRAVAKHGLIVVQSPLARIVLVEAGFKNTVSFVAGSMSERQGVLLAHAANNPSGKVLLLFGDNKDDREVRRQSASLLIRSAFVRYVDSRGIPDVEACTREVLKRALIDPNRRRSPGPRSL